MVDLSGATVLPGLIDAHGHIAGLGAFALGTLDLSRAASFEDVVATVKALAPEAGAGKWILGGRWDHESWAGRALPHHSALSAATPGTPVWLRRVDGHAALANAEAMRLAGVNRNTKSPPGGEIIRDEQGEPTGVFVDTAMDLVEAVLPEDARTTEDLILAAQDLCLAAGLTGVHDAGVSPAEIEVCQRLATSGRLKLRVYAMVSAFHAPRYFAERGITVGERLTVRAAKLYADGAMGSRGAWLLAPYADRPTADDGSPYVGLAIMEGDRIEELAQHGAEHGYQLCTHAIGDRANREVLDAYERALATRPVADHRWRIEHAQLLSPQDIPRFAQLGVVASMQPTHCTSDMRWVDARVGQERALGAYAWASLLRAGAVIAGGSDFPVESHNPFLAIHAAVTRQNDRAEPPGGWQPGERMTREEALRSMTLSAAHSAFEEHEKGSLTPGKRADFIVIDRDIMTCAPGDILETRVLRTIISGEMVYESRPRPSR
ncbi:MAG TPA: amidohydrolase [Phycisphaerales bacterium]|nr:amidohydrolase [Phycisphaerales bacterium]